MEGMAINCTYTLHEELGRGCSGQVFRATNPSGEQFAIKSFLAARFLPQDVVRHLRGEIDTMQRVASPFIVQFHSVIETSQFIYLVMEYCPGGDLAWLTSSDFVIETDLAKRWLLNIAEALRTLAGVNIIHRDVKLNNVILSDRNPAKSIAKLGDFGAARLGPEHSQALTSIGTPLYMAPELHHNRPADLKVDVYSFGVLANLLLRGPLFKSINSYPDLFDEQKRANAVLVACDMEETAKELLIAALTYDPLHRPTIDELRRFRFFEGVSPYPPDEIPLEIRGNHAKKRNFQANPAVSKLANELNVLEWAKTLAERYMREKKCLLAIALLQGYLREVNVCLQEAERLKRNEYMEGIDELERRAVEKLESGHRLLEYIQLRIPESDFTNTSLKYYSNGIWIDPILFLNEYTQIIHESVALPLIPQRKKRLEAMELLQFGLMEEEKLKEIDEIRIVLERRQWVREVANREMIWIKGVLERE